MSKSCIKKVNNYTWYNLFDNLSYTQCINFLINFIYYYKH